MENFIRISISLVVLVFYSFFLIFIVDVKKMFKDGIF